MTGSGNKPGHPSPLDPAWFQDPPTLTGVQVAEQAGVDLDSAKRLRRALGLPEVDDDEVVFDEGDVEVLVALKSVLDLGVSFDEVVSVARVYGETMARIADIETRVFTSRISGPLSEEGLEPAELEERLQPLVMPLMDVLDGALGYVHRAHLAFALERTTHPDDAGTEERGAAFVDLVDFSRISQELHAPELTQLTTKFEELAVEICADASVRLVKVIGDAVMMVASDVEALVRATFTLVQRVTAEEALPSARAGIDVGEVVPTRGDYFGGPVNVAARLTGFALPDTVVISQAVADAASGLEMDLADIGVHRLKGVGKFRIFKIRSIEEQG